MSRSKPQKMTDVSPSTFVENYRPISQNVDTVVHERGL